MDEKKIENLTEELTEEALDAVSGGARTLIAGVDTPSRPGDRPKDRQNGPNPRKIY